VLELTRLRKEFSGERTRGRRSRAALGGAVLAVDDVSFEVQDGELFTLLGPSGCGKTTTLRCIAGLEHPASGVIRLGDKVLFDGRGTNVPVNRRALGMVFQSYAIWPHMSVFRNVAFPLEAEPRRRRLSKPQIRERVARVLETVELSGYEDRPATKLSGGQQQRLALARAMVTSPALTLLDEPLSNLDAKLRESMRFELKRLQRELGLTAIYVTHDQAEALMMSSRIAVMSGGRIVQVGRPRDIYMHPSCRFVAEFVGTSNFVDGVVEGRDGLFTTVRTSEGMLRADTRAELTRGTSVLVSLRPESLAIAPDEPDVSAVNVWRGTVTTRAFVGDSADHVVQVGPYELRARSNPSVSIPPGTAVSIAIRPQDVVLVPEG
jgi:iron(III) transport system ATP-binding protein